jgi:hypothetical protein
VGIPIGLFASVLASRVKNMWSEYGCLAVACGRGPVTSVLHRSETACRGASASGDTFHKE